MTIRVGDTVFPLDRLASGWPVRVREIDLLGHRMLAHHRNAFEAIADWW